MGLGSFEHDRSVKIFFSDNNELFYLIGSYTNPSLLKILLFSFTFF